jgi:hypothetical protein
MFALSPFFFFLWFFSSLGLSNSWSALLRATACGVEVPLCVTSITVINLYDT